MQLTTAHLTVPPAPTAPIAKEFGGLQVFRAGGPAGYGEVVIIRPDLRVDVLPSNTREPQRNGVIDAVAGAAMIDALRTWAASNPALQQMDPEKAGPAPLIHDITASWNGSLVRTLTDGAGASTQTAALVDAFEAALASATLSKLDTSAAS